MGSAVFNHRAMVATEAGRDFMNDLLRKTDMLAVPDSDDWLNAGRSGKDAAKSWRKRDMNIMMLGEGVCRLTAKYFDIMSAEDVKTVLRGTANLRYAQSRLNAVMRGDYTYQDIEKAEAVRFSSALFRNRSQSYMTEDQFMKALASSVVRRPSKRRKPRVSEARG